METALHINVSLPTPSTFPPQSTFHFYLRTSQVFFLNSSQTLLTIKSQDTLLTMPADSDQTSITSSASTLSGNSTDTLVEDEAIDDAAMGEEKTDSAEKSGNTEPPEPAHAQHTTAKTTSEKPAGGKSAHIANSSKGLEPFLYANWGWGGPPCIDFPTAEMRRERQKWEKEKRSG